MAAGEKYSSGHRISESLRLIVIVSLLSYLARGLLRDAADDALDALHPHLQLHGGDREGGVGDGDGDEMGERRRRRRSERRSRCCTPAPLLTMIHRSALTLQASLESEREHTFVNNLLDLLQSDS